MNKTIKKTALTLGMSVASLALAANASAQDWSGPYAGVNLGINTFEGEANNYYGDHSTVSQGQTLGGTVGFNWVEGSAVYGIEADINSGDMSIENSNYDGSYLVEAEWGWYSTIRGRAGLAVDNALVYVTGGIVIADTDYSYCDDDPCEDDTDNASSDGTETGLAFGAGIDIALKDGISLQAEFLHTELETTKTVRENPDEPFSFDSALNTFRLGANWQF